MTFPIFGHVPSVPTVSRSQLHGCQNGPLIADHQHLQRLTAATSQELQGLEPLAAEGEGGDAAVDGDIAGM